ncbi:MAG: hypothetical protein JSS10_00145 [Verrucomicrobia bacterium]|nr:hypothetical protein [Verrucomicrobiota bacterium]
MGTPVLKIVANSLNNIGLNSSAAYSLSCLFETDNPRDVAIIVAIDTVFRMALSIALSALKLPPENPRSIGNLAFVSLTMITQPLSVQVAKRCFGVKPPDYLSTMAYIFFGWKTNLMLKNVIYLANSALNTKTVSR